MSEAPGEVVVQDVAPQAVEAAGTRAVVEGLLRRVLAGAAVVAGRRAAGAVGGQPAGGPRERRRAQTPRALLARDAGAAVATPEAAAGSSVVLAGSAAEALERGEDEKHPPLMNFIIKSRPNYSEHRYRKYKATDRRQDDTSRGGPYSQEDTCR